MAGTPKFTLPTGYEADQRKIDKRRKLADLLAEKGLTSQGPMQSWLQVLGQVGNAYAGKRLDKKADKLDADLKTRMLADYTTARTGFQDTVAKGGDPASIVRDHGANPFLTDDVEPYRKAIEKRITGQEDVINWGGQRRRSGDIPPGTYEPGKPTDSVIRDPQGNWIVNKVANTAALNRQGFGYEGDTPMGYDSMPDPYAAAPMAQDSREPYYSPNPNIPMGSPLDPGMGGPVDPLAPQDTSGISGIIPVLESRNRDYYPGGAPVVSPKGARFAMQVMPETARDPGYGVRPAANESPEEYNRVGRDYAAAMESRYGREGGLAAYNGGPGRFEARGQNISAMPSETRNYVANSRNIPSPAGVLSNGKPYWIVNGKPSPTPESNY